jgi:uncharacterized caspase-like protein
VLLFGFYLRVNAQDTHTGALTGTIVNRITGSPIALAAVQMTNKLTGVPVAKRTDVNGQFYQGLLPPAAYKIKISAQGYESFETEQRILATRVTSLIPVPVMLVPIVSAATLQRLYQVTGSLAVASVPNATIIVDPLDGGPGYKNVILTDQLLCVFDEIPPKTYMVTASLEGYQSAKQEVVISAGKTLPLTLTISPTKSLERIVSQAGRYYALIIGNNNYAHLRKLKTAEADAKEVDLILREKYGVETKLLLNANRKQTLAAIYEYRRKAGPNSNLLIYYAGHGINDTEVEKAYWLPVDATKEDNANWISADDITVNLKGISARHILIVSDSCYSGTINRETDLNMSETGQREKFLQKMADGKSRHLMASGGNEPVADSGGRGHSVFANAFLTGLRETDRDVFTAGELYTDFINQAVAGKSNQTPEYSPLRNSGHESGDFIFVRKRQ